VHPSFPGGRIYVSSIYGASEANAAVLAASAELLEALQEIVDCVSRPPNDGGYHKIDLTKARTAILRATKTGS
jgi:hypothetical protein